nr:hypothetical protein [Bacteroidota bacterium]
MEFQLFIGKGDLLLIDDDGGDNYEDYYIETFDDLELTVNPYDISFRGDLPELMPREYANIIWFTGDMDENTLTASDRNILQNYMDNGGNLFLTGQNIGTDIGTTDFYTNYL